MFTQIEVFFLRRSAKTFIHGVLGFRYHEFGNSTLSNKNLLRTPTVSADALFKLWAYPTMTAHSDTTDSAPGYFQGEVVHKIDPFPSPIPNFLRAA